MTQFSYTKDPGADNVVALAQGDADATPIEISKNPGNATVTFQKNASTKARVVKSGGQSIAPVLPDSAEAVSAGQLDITYLAGIDGIGSVTTTDFVVKAGGVDLALTEAILGVSKAGTNIVRIVWITGPMTGPPTVITVSFTRTTTNINVAGLGVGDDFVDLPVTNSI